MKKLQVSDEIVEKLSDGSEEYSFLIEQDQSSDEDASPDIQSSDFEDDAILSMIQKFNQISDDSQNLQGFRDLLSEIQKNLESDIQ